MRSRVVEPILFTDMEQEEEEFFCLDEASYHTPPPQVLEQHSISQQMVTGESLQECFVNDSEQFLLATPTAYHFRYQFQDMALQFAQLNEQFQKELESTLHRKAEDTEDGTTHEEESGDTVIRLIE